MDNSGLTQSQEDYLETILDLVTSKKRATVSDIARRQGVAKPSVVKAIKKLRKMGLVKQEPYSDIALTEEGTELAERVRLRHDILLRFLSDFLGVNPEKAEADACLLEHSLSECTTDRLMAFVDLNSNSAIRVEKGVNFTPGSYFDRDTCDHSDKPFTKHNITLEELSVGQKGIIIKLNTKGKIRRRLQDLGLVKNVVVEVINTAPLNDPIDIKVKGFDLALRRNEAALIEVEVTE